MPKAKSTETKETKETKKQVIVEGLITSARFGKSRFDDTEKNRLSVKCEEGVIPYEIFDEFYKTVGNKLTPTWLKERNGYINVSSKFDIPVKTVNGRTITFADLIETTTCIGSKIKLALNVKEGATYPISILILEEGEENDPFAMFD